ncbi:MAG: aquaporin [Hyphomicrobium sp.]
MSEPLRVELPARLAAEALGTALLLAAVVGSGIMAERLAGGNVALALLANALATGAALVVLITMFGPVSGAHFNPAVSLVFRLRGELATGALAGYVAAQVCGALVGVLAAQLMFDEPLLQVSGKVRTGTGQWASEVVAAFGLVLTILLTRRARPEAIPTSVGLYIVSAYWFTASTSFANPAVTLARACTNTFAGIRPDDVAAFVACQFVGAMLAWWVAGQLMPSPARVRD